MLLISLFSIQILSLLILVFTIYILLRPLVNGAVYFPTSQANLKVILELADIKTGQKIVDLGSGDGRILIALAKAGVEARGYEINPFLVWKSRLAIKKAGFQDKAFVHWRSFWREDLGSFDVVIVYGIPYIMKKLEKKLKKELRPAAKVISNIYQFPGWSPRLSQNRVYLYLNS